MSRKENYLDNAEMESLFGRLKTECFYDLGLTKIKRTESNTISDSVLK